MILCSPVCISDAENVIFYNIVLMVDYWTRLITEVQTCDLVWIAMHAYQGILCFVLERVYTVGVIIECLASTVVGVLVMLRV